ncbi:GNAT family N-acetyltransferase [Roseococcus pinisoli]|uniref:GNAT family N-acetyltransferase n=1 Tax=Roseococcus pinisoli TaxID=2835040 RepID=UPI0024BD9287|nr:GNAT family N-acetyltransferase [Roseococcus pinisoli]
MWQAIARGTSWIDLVALRYDAQLEAPAAPPIAWRSWRILPTYAAGEWMRFSCGRALMKAMIEWSIAQGFRIFDLTVGDEAYKKDWTDHSMPLYAWQQGVTLPGRGFLVLQGIRAWA